MLDLKELIKEVKFFISEGAFIKKSKMLSYLYEKHNPNDKERKLIEEIVDNLLRNTTKNARENSSDATWKNSDYEEKIYSAAKILLKNDPMEKTVLIKKINEETGVGLNKVVASLNSLIKEEILVQNNVDTTGRGRRKLLIKLPFVEEPKINPIDSDFYKISYHNFQLGTYMNGGEPEQWMNGIQLYLLESGIEEKACDVVQNMAKEEFNGYGFRYGSGKEDIEECLRVLKEGKEGKDWRIVEKILDIIYNRFEGDTGPCPVSDGGDMVVRLRKEIEGIRSEGKVIE